jgi:hypothetical protein
VRFVRNDAELEAGKKPMCNCFERLLLMLRLALEIKAEARPLTSQDSILSDLADVPDWRIVQYPTPLGTCEADPLDSELLACCWKFPSTKSR